MTSRAKSYAPPFSRVAAIGGEHRTIALDTIGRAELAEITSLTGATHLVTASPLVCAAEEHLNAALPHMDGELVVLLHGGEMPLPDLIDVLAGDFTDDRTWMAQGSQAIHDTAHRGYDLVAAGADESIHATTQRPVALCETSNWYGSAAMLRRSTIDDLGGVPTGSETPALQMSLRAARHGWRATCHHEPVVHSASPDVRALNDRYARWTTGTLRALRSGDSPLWAEASASLSACRTSGLQRPASEDPAGSSSWPCSQRRWSRDGSHSKPIQCWPRRPGDCGWD
ncbi:MAG: glycosyltransferase [Microthrixaceae bacterium]|nr:glycosyltransferase [Microthrixaceae bacterium]